MRPRVSCCARRSDRSCWRADAPARRSPRAVAPGAPELGVMLPYSPLHHLLLADIGMTLVMTSGNVSDEPICFADEEVLDRLGAIADLFLVHDRPIQTRTDDSVVRVLSGRGSPSGGVPAALARVRAGRHPAARRRHLAAAAGLRRRAEEHVLRGEGRPRMGLASHRRPVESRDAALVHRGGRALRAAVCGLARGRRARPSPRVPLDEVRERARGHRADRRPAPSRPPGGLSRRARRAGPCGRRDLRRQRPRSRRNHLGRGAAPRGRRGIPPRRCAAAGSVARR